MKFLTVHAFIIVLAGAIIGEFTTGWIRKIAWGAAAAGAVIGALMAFGQK